MKTKKIQQAILLAAGLGTRLRPLTQSIPKPALPVGGLPIIFYNLMLLQEAGIQHVVVNLYHRPQILTALLSQIEKSLSLKITFSFENKILGTAGGIAQALKKMLPASTLVFNGDILTDFSLKHLMQKHQRTSAQATLLCLDKSRAQVKNHVFYQRDKKILGIQSKSPASQKTKPLFKAVFAGLHILEPELLEHYPAGQFGCIVHQVYRPAIQSGKNFQALLHKGSWWDLGTLETLKSIDQKLWQGDQVSKKIKQIRKKLFELFPCNFPG